MSPSATASPRHARTRYAILGMLGAQGPASGYDLHQRIDSSVGHFWQEGYGQLYPVLGQLTREALVVRVDDPHGGARRRAEYRITPEGRVALAEWLRQPPARHVERNELLVKIFFATLGDIDECAWFVEESRNDAQARLRHLRAVAEELSAAPEQPERPLWLLTLDYGIRGLGAHIEWCDTAIQTLRGLSAARTDGETR